MAAIKLKLVYSVNLTDRRYQRLEWVLILISFTCLFTQVKVHLLTSQSWIRGFNQEHTEASLLYLMHTGKLIYIHQ